MGDRRHCRFIKGSTLIGCLKLKLDGTSPAIAEVGRNSNTVMGSESKRKRKEKSREVSDFKL